MLSTKYCSDDQESFGVLMSYGNVFQNYAADESIVNFLWLLVLDLERAH